MAGPRTVIERTGTESRPAIAAADPPASHSSIPIATGHLRALRTGRRTMRWIAVVLPPVLVGYALFDKAFAYLSIPGVPIYAGEILILLSLTAAVVATGYMRRGLEHSAAAKLILVFVAWGLVRTIPFLSADGINAVRDAAIWYYALLAIAVSALVIRDGDLLSRWTLRYRRFIPWLLAFSPIASYLAGHTVGGLTSIMVPGSNVSIWDHKPGNTAVQVTIAIAFLWLIPGAGGRLRPLLTGFGTIVLLILATQNRSGFVAAIVALALVWLFSKKRGRLAVGFVATVFLVIASGWALNIQLTTEGGRTVSVNQLLDNVQSLSGGNGSQESGNLEDNVEFRERLWSATLDKVKSEKKVLTGLGFGPSLANDVGFADAGPSQLRSPHNSHLDIFARMGVIGITLWVSLWACWCFTAVQARKRLRAAGRMFEKAVVEVCIVGVTAILVNAYFDPTLESPPVAIWLWVLVGIGLGLSAVSRRTRATASLAQTRTSY